MKSPTPPGTLRWIACSSDPLATFTRICLGVSLVLHLTAAVFSAGFHYPDEHFQILEFANAKLGRTPFSDLAWEYPAHMRPWLQPAAAYAVVSLMRWAGIENPFIWATGLRLISAQLGWCAVVAFCCCVFGWLRSDRIQRYTILALTTLWFLPYLHARFSSESWSGSLFFLGFLPLVRAVQRNGRAIHPVAAFGCGTAMGLAFEARYQAALLIVGALLWCLRYARLSRPTWIGLCAGGIFAAVLGTALDHWGYAVWTIAPLNYLRLNIFKDIASKFGRYPFWMYALWVGLLGPPPLGLLFLLGLAVTWIAKPRFSLTWCTLPFVVVQSLIAHKEPRYLFPIFLTFPVVAATAWQALEPHVRVPDKIYQALKAWFVFCVIANAVLAAIVILLPARKIVSVYVEAYERRLTELHSVDDDPYKSGVVSLHFYRPGLRVIKLATYDDLARVLAGNAGPVWLFRRGLDLPPEAAALQSVCHPEWQSILAWRRRDRWRRWVAALEGRSVFPDTGINLAAPRSLYRCEAERRSGGNEPNVIGE